MKFFNAESKEELEMLVAERPQMKISKAVARLEELSQDERARMLFESRQMLEWDIRLDKEAAVKSNTIEIATNMLRGGMPVVDVSSYTGMSYNDVESLSKSI